MVRPRGYKEVLNGRLVTAQPRRTHVEVKIYAGETEDGHPIAELEMPEEYRYLLHLAAAHAEMQTERQETHGLRTDQG